MDHMWSVVTTSTALSWPRRRARQHNVKKQAAAKKDQLWKCRRHGKRLKASLPAAAWKSPAQKQRDFPTFPQLLVLDKCYLKQKPKPDISLATKTGHFNLLSTRLLLRNGSAKLGQKRRFRRGRRRANSPSGRR